MLWKQIFLILLLQRDGQMQSFKSVAIIGHALGNKDGKEIQAVMYPLRALFAVLKSVNTVHSPFLFYNKYRGILPAGELF